MKYKQLLCFTLLSFYMLGANSKPSIAVGWYKDAEKVKRPLLALSHDKGFDWYYPSSVLSALYSRNNYFSNASFSSSSCNEQMCIAAGQYNENDPLLALSRDGGEHWLYPQSINTAHFFLKQPFGASVKSMHKSQEDTWGQFNNSYCSDSYCIAVGTRIDYQKTQRPLLIISHDQGTSWTYPAAIASPVFTDDINSFEDGGVFYDVTCSQSHCMAVGEYSDVNIVTRPLLAKSKDNGHSWYYPAATNDPYFVPNNPHPFITDGLFNKISCADALCVASGNYTATHDTTRPLLGVSNDFGNTWIFPAEITHVSFTPESKHPFLSDGIFNSSSCNQNTCIAVGFYHDVKHIVRPLLAISHDKGSHWTYPSTLTEPVFTPDNSHSFHNNGTFFESYCNDVTCIAVGYYIDQQRIERPLLAVSQDSGRTWVFPSSATTPQLPNSFANDGDFRSIRCSESVCIASGRYKDQNNIYRPLIAVSRDAGSHWTFPASVTEPVLSPENNYSYWNYGSLNNMS